MKTWKMFCLIWMKVFTRSILTHSHIPYEQDWSSRTHQSPSWSSQPHRGQRWSPEPPRKLSPWPSIWYIALYDTETRWSTERADGQYKDHLDGHLTTINHKRRDWFLQAGFTPARCEQGPWCKITQFTAVLLSPNSCLTVQVQDPKSIHSITQSPQTV